MRRIKTRRMYPEILTPDLLLYGYSHGIFPMAIPEENNAIYWYAPDPRAVIPLDERFHISDTLRKTIKKQAFELKFDSDFRGVMQGCAERDTTWISDEICMAYTELHRLGYGHSVECWQGGALAGGLYGVAIGGAFFGESMFSRVRDASKVALVHLVEHLRKQGFTLLDTQFITPHLATFGAYEIPRTVYEHTLQKALRVKAVW